MARFAIHVGLALALLSSSCKTVGPEQNVSRVKGEATEVSLAKLSSVDDFNRLALPNKISYPFIKFSHFYAFPSTDPLFDAIFFQDTKKYEFHANFLQDNFPRYKDVKNYEDLILPPRGDESGPSIKEITAGAVYYRPKSHPDGELMVYQIYFREQSGATSKTLVDLEEVARFDKKLKSAVSFVPPEKIVYMLNYKADLFAWKSKLAAKGVSIVERTKFEVPPKGATTYVKASSYGYIRTISMDEFEKGNYSDKDILVFKNIPLDVGPIAGVITEVPAAAHSHVMFRAQNLNVPGMFIPDAGTVPEIASNVGKLVKFTSNEDNTYKVETIAQIPGIQAEAEAFWKERRKVLETPVADLSVKNVKVWNKEGVEGTDIRIFGAKATNFAILDKALVASGVNRARYTNGFMVPFSHFDKHMEQKLTKKSCDDAAKKCATDTGAACTKAAATCNADTAANGTLRTFVKSMVSPDNVKEMNANPVHRREYLGFMQRLIRETPLDPANLEQVRVAMTAYPNTVRMRLRSSTNAEDIQGLNGAGLYESKSACLGDDEKAKDDDGKNSACRTPYEVTRMTEQAAKLRSFEDTDGKLKAMADELQADITKKYPLSKAIRAVYASLWTERSFLTREFYGLKHEGIFMGMLSHPSFVDEKVNGVAVVTFTDGEPSGLKVEAQYEDISVTNPIYPATIPELWAANIKGGIVSDQRVVTQSTLSAGGKTVLNAEELAELGRQLAISAKALRGVRGGDRYDLEFILDKDRTVLIKQGRPL